MARRAHSLLGRGAESLERQKFADTWASLLLDGELLHLEDLVLHDATRDIRTPSHPLTIPRHVSVPFGDFRATSGLRFSAVGIRSLRKW